MKCAFVQVLFLLFAGNLPFIHFLNAQNWDWVVGVGQEEDEAGRAVRVAPNGDIFWAGTFEEESQVGDVTLNSMGGDDLFIARYSETGTPLWVRAIGSPFNDGVAGLAIDPAGNLVVGGTYWLNVQIGSEDLSTQRNPKSIFLAKYDPAGQVLWARSIDGSDSKDLNDVKVGEDGSLLLAGYFSDSLFIGDTILAARGDTDLFAAKWTADGQLSWAGNWGYTGDARATCLTPDGSGGVVVGGFYNDTLIVENTLIRAISLDLDVFLLRLDPQGQPQWLRKAGGVQDQEITGLVLAPDGDIYGTGFLVGVMTLSNGVVIQSQTGNPDVYLFRYSLDGTAQDARTFGNTQVQQSTGIVANGSNLVIAGFYQGELSIDGQTAAAGSGFAGFAAGFTADLQLRWLSSVTGDQPVLIAGISAGDDGSVYTTGTFAGTSDFDGQSLSTAGKNDAFLARLFNELTPLRAPSPPGVNVRVFPNPAGEWLWVDCNLREYEIRLYDYRGRMIRHQRDSQRVDLRGLPAGGYLVQVVTPEGWVATERIFRLP